jgi:glutamine synthetase
MNTIVEYVWIGGQGEVRSKTRVLTSSRHIYLSDIPDWNFDGSSTGQADGNYSEVIIKPRALWKCPFRGDPHRLVFCDTYLPSGEPHPTNYRVQATKIFNQDLDQKPWYGLEQEYFLLDPQTGYPLGFDVKTGNPPRLGFQGPYYCGVGGDRAFGRVIAEEHLQACVQAGIKICGLNAEVAPGQWEYQIGPCEGIEAGDHVWMSRYILLRIAEKHGVCVDFRPKPIKGDWNGSGCHTNFSTLGMREGAKGKSGWEIIQAAIHRLAEKHMEHMAGYGDEDNRERMTGKLETSKYDEFSYGVANRGASVRIPSLTKEEGRGYFEDRRPASNCDPYRVTALLFQTCVLEAGED